MAEDKTVSKEPRKIMPVQEIRMFQRESKVRDFLFIVDAATEPEDCVDPAFWAHVARYFEEYTELTVYNEDWSWRAHFVVQERGANWAKVQPLGETIRFGQFAPTGAGFVLPGYEIKHAGSFAKWRVLRTADKQVIRDKFTTKADAEAWLVEYAKSIAA